jgi:membrane protein implicated in regulation of membrane protease activity
MESLKGFLEPEVVWILVGIVLFLLEFVMPGLIIAFFGVGACVVAGVCLVVDISIDAQLIIFIASSIVLLVCLRKWLKGIFMGHSSAKQDMTEDMKEFVGQKVVVVSKIVPKVGGKVELHGTNWQAEADEEIDEGVVVEIIEKNNLTFKVKIL